ncbi:hypothetical protein FOA52_010403 [Chlamydomonas sp. UWO 241]|nr:hypothetical protein FOA52_010403 [Chlamydomonas sp. UWO 241]
MGDGFASARDLEAGELVLRCAPLAAAPKDAYLHSVCAACFRRGASSGDAGPSTVGGGVSLTPCGRCCAASFCSACASSAWVTGRHAEECGALGELMRLRGGDGSGGGPGGGGRAGISRELRALRAEWPAAASGSGAPAGAAPVPVAETAPLRLLLLLACEVARARRPQPAPPPPDGHYGEGDVVRDSAGDLEELVGDPEDDLDDAAYAAYAEGCGVLKVVQPAWARAAAASYLRWATKLHLNAHDVCVPRGGSGTGTGTQGGRDDATAAVAGAGARASGGAKRRREARAGTGTAGAAASASPLLSVPHACAVGEGLFPSVARFNHSCAPNIVLSYDEAGCCCARVAPGMRVSAGDQLFTAYVNPGAPRER